jgi:hypothetical protein
MRMIVTASLALALTAWACGARADAPAGATCAAILAPDGKAIYAVVAAANPTSETLKAVVEHETRGLAMAGKIGRGNARENAVAAGECLKARLQ